MKKIVRITENELINIVKRVIKEDYDFEDGIPFPKPITVGGKVYKNTNELESDFEIGSITNFNDEIKIDGQPYEEWVESMGGLETDLDDEDYN